MKKKVLGILTTVMMAIVVLNVPSAGEIGEAKQVFSSTSRLDDIYGVSVSCSLCIGYNLQCRRDFRDTWCEFIQAFFEDSV